jgi:hypothetical protein
MTAPQLTRYVQGQSIVSGDQLNTFQQTCDNVTQLRALVGTQGMQIFVRGTLAPADGGGGDFYWNSTSTGPDNGTSIIVPTGSAVGAWVLLPLNAAGLGYTAPGTGGITRTISSKLGDFINVQDYGVVGGGAAGDTAALQNALNYANTVGAQYVWTGPLIIGPISSITVPQGVTLLGPWENPGLIPNNGNYYTLEGQIILAVGATISVAELGAVRGLYITRAGLSLPATTDAQATSLLLQYSGTACISLGPDTCYRDLCILGHTQAITTSSGVGSMGRMMVDNVKGDCTAGILINNSYDTDKINNCHFWPFMTVNVPGVSNANLQRAGTSYGFTNSGSWATVVGCFSFGYQIGFLINDASALRLIGCGADDTGPSGPGGQNFGIQVIGDNDQTIISGTFVNSKQFGLYVDTSTPQPNVSSTGNAYNTATGIDVATGFLSSTGDNFNGCASGILCGAGTFGTIIGDVFNNVTTPFQFADSPTSVDWGISGNIFVGGSVHWVGAEGQNQGIFTIVQGTPTGGGAGAQLNFFNNYNSYTGIAWEFSTPLTDGTTGAEGSNLLINRYQNGALHGTFQIDASGNIQPAIDNTYSCGVAALRWSVVYAATGTINTSSGDSKTDVLDLPAALPMVKSIMPKTYKFKVGSNVVSNGETVPLPGKRTHWGFIAEDVKNATPQGMDWAAYVKMEDGSEGLRHDEMLPVLWKAVQELSGQVDSLRAQLAEEKS